MAQSTYTIIGEARDLCGNVIGALVDRGSDNSLPIETCEELDKTDRNWKPLANTGIIAYVEGKKDTYDIAHLLATEVCCILSCHGHRAHIGQAYREHGFTIKLTITYNGAISDREMADIHHEIEDKVKVVNSIYGRATVRKSIAYYTNEIYVMVEPIKFFYYLKGYSGAYTIKQIYHVHNSRDDIYLIDGAHGEKFITIGCCSQYLKRNNVCINPGNNESLEIINKTEDFLKRTLRLDDRHVLAGYAGLQECKKMNSAYQRLPQYWGK